jgi:hypothetical protein
MRLDEVEQTLEAELDRGKKKEDETLSLDFNFTKHRALVFSFIVSQQIFIGIIN